MSTVLLSTAYFPPIEYFQTYAEADHVSIDQHEHYQKQTYRNRMCILGANGKLDLSIPVKKFANHTPIKDIQISYDTPWQKLHWRSIVSAYNSSPYFMYYDYQLQDFFEKKSTFLLDYNMEIMEKIIGLLKLENKHQLSSTFKPYGEEKEDYRLEISPKNKVNKSFKKYTQVFDQKFGFTEQLSILDLLFNQGPQSKLYL
jgi:hypothetical protein